MAETGKSELRKFFRIQRNAFVADLSDGERAIAFSHPPAPLAHLFAPGKIVAGYVAVGSEADPSQLLSAAINAGCTAALPYVTSKAAPMQFLQWTPGDVMEDGPFGLKQPAQTATAVSPDVILVPMLAFDANLCRLGQGAGHYDRALSILPDAVAIGIAWSVQETDLLPADPWDIPLNAILTEKAWTTR
jgi:5-formyltetrahydrofolate cyclo-ligase